METLTNLVADAPRVSGGNVSYQETKLSYQEKRLLEKYMSVGPSYSECDSCNSCGSGDCNSCCESGDN